MPIDVGHLVTFAGAPGIGRVSQINHNSAQVDFFESAAEPVVGSVRVAIADLREAWLDEQTRVFFKDRYGRWHAGRILAGGPRLYAVRLPNVQLDFEIPVEMLRVRWEKPPRDPLQVLLSGANETPRFRDAREPVRRLLLAERAAAASATGIMSAGIRLHAHQLDAALRIIRDPVQRYLLADEVGLGKTIQAGLAMRQLLIDGGNRRIGLVVPEALAPQWRAELLSKFFLDDFRTPQGALPFKIVAHEDPESWTQLLGSDLLVVDEAHLLTRTSNPQSQPYCQLAEIAHSAPRVLMLSATPFSRHVTSHLALLHLLDPQMFRWEDRDRFEALLEARRELALAVHGLEDDPDPEIPELLDVQLDEIQRLVPHDETLRATTDRIRALFGEHGSSPVAVDREALRAAVAAVRVHVSETYRLHHRVIRNRRHNVESQRLDDEGLMTPLEFTGRARPRVMRLASAEATAAVDAVSTWMKRYAAAVLDEELEPAAYGLVLGILVSRCGGPARDLRAILDYRVNGTMTAGLLRTSEVELIDATPVAAFEADILDELKAAEDTDGLSSLAEVVAARSGTSKRVIVFCGRGALARCLVDQLLENEAVHRVYAHVAGQTEAERETATEAWRAMGGLLIADDSGDLGRNFQDAERVFHARLPWNPNVLEQRIGRIDRYGKNSPASQFAVVDSDPDAIPSAWLKLLANGFGIFDGSVSALQEEIDELAKNVWSGVLREGLEAMAERKEAVQAALNLEKRRIDELDALEASFRGFSDGEELALSIARFENDSAGHERAYVQLIEGAEGFRFAGRKNRDGSLTFGEDPVDRPLISPRLLQRLKCGEPARTGTFDRWTAKTGQRLFRRGNPFIDGIEEVLALDDRGQASALWRLDQHWAYDPLTYFGYDFVVEADLAPLLDVLKGQSDTVPVARRRADTAFRPQHHRVWVPVNTQQPVVDPALAADLSQPFTKNRDVNLNSHRIPALHTLLGGEKYLAPVAEGCLLVARRHLEVVSDIVQMSLQAGERVRRETGDLIAQSLARSQAASLVGDPASLDAQVVMGKALEASVTAPAIRLSAVSCVVISARSWAAYVQG